MKKKDFYVLKKSDITQNSLAKKANQNSRSEVGKVRKKWVGVTKYRSLGLGSWSLVDIT